MAEELGGLPKQKFHCSNLGAQALNRAIDDYLEKKTGQKPVTEHKHIDAEVAAEAAASCCCPTCGDELKEGEAPYCQPCQVTPRT